MTNTRQDRTWTTTVEWKDPVEAWPAPCSCSFRRIVWITGGSVLMVCWTWRHKSSNEREERSAIWDYWAVVCRPEATSMAS